MKRRRRRRRRGRRRGMRGRIQYIIRHVEAVDRVPVAR
jgi:hypothetical protein